MNTIKCSGCGTVNAADLSYCLQCGRALHVQPAQTLPVLERNAVTEEFPPKRSAQSNFKRNLAIFGGLGCFTLVLGLIALFGLYLFFNRLPVNNSNDRRNSNFAVTANDNSKRIPNVNSSNGFNSKPAVNSKSKDSVDEATLPAFKRGLEAYQKGDYENSVKEFTDVIEHTSTTPFSYYNRGLAYYKRMEYDLALDDFTDSIKLNPRSAKTFYGRALTYLQKKQFALAVADDTEAIRLDPQLADAYANRGANYYYQFQLKTAIDDYNRAIQINPKVAQYYSLRGAAKSEGGNFDEAFKDYDKAVSLDRNNIDVYRFRAVTYRRQNKTALAEADEDRVKELTQ